METLRWIMLRVHSVKIIYNICSWDVLLYIPCAHKMKCLLLPMGRAPGGGSICVKGNMCAFNWKQENVCKLCSVWLKACWDKCCCFFSAKRNTEMLCEPQRGWTSLFVGSRLAMVKTVWHKELVLNLSFLVQDSPLCVMVLSTPTGKQASTKWGNQLFSFSLEQFKKKKKKVIVTSSQQTRHSIESSCQAHLHLTGWLDSTKHNSVWLPLKSVFFYLNSCYLILYMCK